MLGCNILCMRNNWKAVQLLALFCIWNTLRLWHGFLLEVTLCIIHTFFAWLHLLCFSEFIIKNTGSPYNHDVRTYCLFSWKWKLVTGDRVVFVFQWHFCDQCTTIGIPILHTSTRQIPHAKIDISLSPDSECATLSTVIFNETWEN